MLMGRIRAAWFQRIAPAPERWYLLIAVPLMAAYVGQVSPFIDYSHGVERFLRVIEYAMSLRGEPGRIPVGYIEFVRHTGTNKLEKYYGAQLPIWRSELAQQGYTLDSLKTEPGKHANTFASLLTLSSQTSLTVPFQSTAAGANHSAVGYVPFIVPATIGLVLDWPPVVVMYAMIITNALFAIGLGYWTIRLAPTMKIPLALLLLLPSVLVQQSVIMPDAIATALCFLIVSLVLRYRLQMKPLSRAKQAGTALLSLLIGLVKIGYFLVPAVLLLLPASCFSTSAIRRYFIMTCLLFSLVTAGAWNIYSAHRYYHLFSPIGQEHVSRQSSPSIAVQTILSQPFTFYTDLLSTLATRHYLEYWAANLMLWNGHLDVRNNWMYQDKYVPLLWAGLIVLTMLAIAPYREPVLALSWRDRSVCAVIFIITSLMIATLVYVMFYRHYNYSIPFVVTPEKSDFIQGRFFIPLLPLLTLTVHQGVSWPARGHHIVRLLTIALVIATLGVMHMLALSKFALI